MAVGLLASLFVASGLLRRLNFDESLALRSGWLLWARVDAAPDFTMPFTLVLGWLGHHLEDPGAVFLVARIATVSILLGALAVVACQVGSRGHESLLFSALTLGNGAFAVHAYEFRYDAAILALLLLGLPLASGRRTWQHLASGSLAALITMHHLKGIWFGVALLLVALMVPAEAERRRRASIAALAAGFASTWIAWLAICARLGIADDVLATYRTFLSLARGTDRLWPWESIRGYIVKDAVWWLLCGAGAVLAARAIAERGTSASRPDIARLALPLAGAGLAFLFLHPHPWPYLLVIPVPFLALVAARGFAARAPRLVPWLAIYLLAVAAVAPWSPYVLALKAPRTGEVETLRALQGLAVDGDEVFDPSGLAYFLPPCTREWYLDTLFAQDVERGQWMLELAQAPRSTCRWLVDTYRVDLLPASWSDRIRDRYVDIGGGLAILRADPRADALAGSRAGEPAPASFWW